MNSNINKGVIIFYSHFLLYPVYLNGISNTVQQAILFGFLLLWSFININQIEALFSSFNYYKKEVILSATLYITAFTSAFIIPILHGTFDFSYFANFTRSTFYMVAYLVLLAMIREENGNKNLLRRVLEVFTKVTRNYVIITILFLVVPQIKNIWLSLIRVTSTHLSLFTNPSYITRIGWVGYSGFTLTIFCTISVVFSLFLILDEYRNTKRFSYNYLSLLIFSLIGNAFYGRSGLAISLVMVLFAIVYMIIFHKKYGVIALLMGALIVFLVLVNVLKNLNSTLMYWYNWIMEPIIAFKDTGVLQTSSTNRLMDMWFIPDLKTLFLGDGYYVDPLTNSYYMDTDVGYLRPILFYGLFLSSLIYVASSILALKMWNSKKENNLLIIMILSTMFLFEVKGEIIFTLTPILIVLFITQSITTESNERNKLSNIDNQYISLGDNYGDFMGRN